MRLKNLTLSAVPLALVAPMLLIGLTESAHALSMKECSAKYKEAKDANTLNGQDWKAFRAAQCGAASTAATPAAATTAPPPASAPPPPPAPPMATAPAAASKASAAPAAASSGPAVFPNAIAPKYASETPGKGRMHTCLDQYKANKADNANGGMHWIQKGGGYYSECSKHLKG